MLLYSIFIHNAPVEAPHLSGGQEHLLPASFALWHKITMDEKSHKGLVDTARRNPSKRTLLLSNTVTSPILYG